MKTVLSKKFQEESCQAGEPWHVYWREDALTSGLSIDQGGLGVRPIFTTENELQRYISPHFSELAPAAGALTPDPLARLSLLCFGRTFGVHTLVNEIRRLPAGDQHEIRDSGITSTWSDKLEDRNMASVQEVADIFIAGVRQSISFDRIGWLPLTGGVDSRVIASALGSIPGIRSYTRGTRKDGECIGAGGVAQSIGFSHRVFPYADSYFDRYAEQIMKLTGGMVSIDHGHAIHPLKEMSGTADNIVIPGINGEYGRRFWTAGVNGKVVVSIEEVGSQLFNIESLIRKKQYQNLLTDEGYRLYQDLKNSYLTAYENAAELARFKHPIAWNDEFYLRERVRSFTAFGGVIWNSRFYLKLPFLDYNYIQAMRTLPPDQRMGLSVHTEIIRKTHPELLQKKLFPSGLPMCPKTIDHGKRFLLRNLVRVTGRKQRKSPQSYAAWLRNEARFISPLIENISDATCGLVRQDQVKKLWQEHLRGKDHHQVICRLITMTLFDNLFMHQKERFNEGGDTDNWR